MYLRIDHFERVLSFRSWGFRSLERKFDVCEIDEVVYFHKFTNVELDCFWSHFAEHRQLCSIPEANRTADQLEKTRPLFCEFAKEIQEIFRIITVNSGSPALWYRFNSTDPILEGPNRGRCGKDFNKATCPVDPQTWPKSDLGKEIGLGIRNLCSPVFI